MPSLVEMLGRSGIGVRHYLLDKYVTEIVETFEKSTGVKINHVYGTRHAGDLAECYANPNKAAKMLGWKAEKTLEDMCRDTWNWQRKNPMGYKK